MRQEPYRTGTTFYGTGSSQSSPTEPEDVEFQGCRYVPSSMSNFSDIYAQTGPHLSPRQFSTMSNIQPSRFFPEAMLSPPYSNFPSREADSNFRPTHDRALNTSNSGEMHGYEANYEKYPDRDTHSYYAADEPLNLPSPDYRPSNQVSSAPRRPLKVEGNADCCFELRSIQWKPEFPVKQHKPFLSSLEKLWVECESSGTLNSKSTSSSKEDEVMMSEVMIQPIEPADVISAFLHGEPADDAYLIRVLNLFREHGRQIGMTTNKAGYDMGHVIIQSSDLMVQSLLPFLVYNGYNVYNDHIPRDRSLLHIAWCCQNKFAFRTLLQAGADLNQLYGVQKQTILHHMLQMLSNVYQRSEMVELQAEYIGTLLKRGADVNIPNADGISCTDYIDPQLIQSLRQKCKKLTSNLTKETTALMQKFLKQTDTCEHICSFLPQLRSRKRMTKKADLTKGTEKLLFLIERSRTADEEL